MNYSRAELNAKFLDEFEGDVDDRTLATGSDSYVFRIINKTESPTLLKIFSGTHEKAAKNGFCPRMSLEWYFAYMRDKKKFLKNRANPLRDSFQGYDFRYDVSDPGVLIERNGVLGAIINDVKVGPCIDQCDPEIEDLVQGTYRYLVRSKSRVNLLSDFNIRCAINDQDKLIDVTFTDLANGIVTSYENDLRFRTKSIVSA